MKTAELNRLTGDLSVAIGLSVAGELSASGQEFTIYATDVPRPYGFTIEVEVGWRSIRISFRPETFASELVKQIASASKYQMAQFSYCLGVCSAEGARVFLKRNGSEAEVTGEVFWADNLNQFEYYIKKVGVDVNIENHEESYRAIRHWALLFFSSAISILPIDEADFGSGVEGGVEGAKTSVLESRYERNKINRALCIEYHGTNCKGCGLEMSDRYGSIARGYIHVHHVVPLSEMHGERVVDPIKEMVPLCPNCHSVVHLVNPPLSISELRRRIVTLDVDHAGR